MHYCFKVIITFVSMVCLFCAQENQVFAASPSPTPAAQEKKIITEESACIPGKSEERETVPAKVKFDDVLKDILALKTIEGAQLVKSISPEFKAQLQRLFEADPKTISKLEQFYGLLYYLAANKAIDARKISLEPKSVRKLLLSSVVFSTPDVPNQIRQVDLFWSDHYKKASYEVRFNEDKEFRLALNNGRGFANFREGLCQIAKNVIFYGGFSFDVELTRKDNIVVSNFKDCDLFGTFGARGAVDVDLQYVTVKSVEFIKGSPLGVVRAKISDREFKENDHSFLLKLVSKLVTDKSTQPIDW